MGFYVRGTWTGTLHLRFAAGGGSEIRKCAAMLALVMCFGGTGATAGPSASDQEFLADVGVAKPPTGAAQLCQTYPWACTIGAGRIAKHEVSAIEQLNRRVNGHVRDVSDLQQFGRHEHWSLPTVRGGDCEDIALLKKQKLIAMGFPPQALLIATVLDRNRFGHAVLIVRTELGDMVLDNQTNRVLPWADTGYIFLRMQDPKSPKRWVSLI